MISILLPKLPIPLSIYHPDPYVLLTSRTRASWHISVSDVPGPRLFRKLWDYYIRKSTMCIFTAFNLQDVQCWYSFHLTFTVQYLSYPIPLLFQIFTLSLMFSIIILTSHSEWPCFVNNEVHRSDKKVNPSHFATYHHVIYLKRTQCYMSSIF